MGQLGARLDARIPHAVVMAVAAGLAIGGAYGMRAAAVAAIPLAAAASGTAPRALLIVALALGGGATLGAARVDATGAERADIPDGAVLAGRAHLQEPARPGPFGASAEIAFDSGDADGIRLLARFPSGVAVPERTDPGLEVQLAGRYRRIDRSGTDPGYADHLRRRGVVGELRVESARWTGRRRGGAWGAFDAIRRRASLTVADGLAPTSAALARGMVLGADEAIPLSVRDDFRDASLAHVLAVSGQNVLLLTVLAIPLLAALGLTYRARMPVLIALIAIYVPVAGAGPSIQRAGVMGVASLLALTLARPASRWYVLGLAACGTLLVNPLAVGDPGWQLSFAAVAGILLLASGIAGALAALPRVLADGIALTVAATVATAPLIAHHFGAVSLAGIPANVVAMAVVAPIMWLGMLRAAVGPFSALDGPLGRLSGTANDALGVVLEPLLLALERIAAVFADAPGAHVAVPLKAPAAVAAAYVAIAIAVYWTGRARQRLDTRASTLVAYVRRLPRRRRLTLALIAVLLVGLSTARGLAPPGPPGALTITFFDVGQGDATLIQHPDGSAVLFDGGPPEGGVVRLLRRAGVRRLSALVMTHASRDHHGGLTEVVERIPVEVLLDGGDGSRDPEFRRIAKQAQLGGAKRIDALAPMSLRAGSIRIEVLSPRPRPPGPSPDDPNPRAVVAVVSCDGFDLLLSGDAESEALLPLGLPDVDAMKLPHHGSADAGLPDLLRRLRPEMASIPVGENSYGHPAPSTLGALSDARIPTWRNDRNGTVRVKVDHAAVAVEAERGGPVSGGP